MLRASRTTLSRRTFALSAMAAVAPVAWARQVPPSGALNALLADWVDQRHQCLGASLCKVSAHGVEVAVHGIRGIADPQPVDSHTVFGIASLTKVFTGLLLADAVVRGEVSLDDPARKYLPVEVSLPRYADRDITLVDLATHTSGLPHEITDHVAASARTGAAREAPLFEFLDSCSLSRPIGSQWTYSNVGYALLGVILAQRTGMEYGELIHKRVTTLLGMESTSLSSAPTRGQNRASPHTDNSSAAPEWNKPWSLAAGGLQSNAQDLGRFLEAAMGLRRTRLQAAFAAMLATTRPAPFLGGDQALGWGIDRSQGDARVFFGGRAPGFTSAMMFDPAVRQGVAALGNSSLMIESLAREALRPGSTRQEAQARPAFTPDPALDRLTGKYVLTESHRDANLAVGEIFDIVRTEGSVAVSMPRYPRVELRKLDANRFEIEGFSVAYVFQESAGPSPGFAVTIGGRSVGAQRLAD